MPQPTPPTQTPIATPPAGAQGSTAHPALRDLLLAGACLAFAGASSLANGIDAAYAALYLAGVLCVRHRFGRASLATPWLLLHLSACLVIADNFNKIYDTHSASHPLLALLENHAFHVLSVLLLSLVALGHALWRLQWRSLLVVLNLLTSAAVLPLEVGKNLAVRQWYAGLPPGHVTQVVHDEVFVCAMGEARDPAGYAVRGVHVLPCAQRQCQPAALVYSYASHREFSPDCNRPALAAWLLEQGPGR